MAEADVMFLLHQDADMQRFFGNGHVYTPEESHTWLEWHVGMWDLEGFSFFATTLKSDMSFVGWVGLNKVMDDPRFGGVHRNRLVHRPPSLGPGSGHRRSDGLVVIRIRYSGAQTDHRPVSNRQCCIRQGHGGDRHAALEDCAESRDAGYDHHHVRARCAEQEYAVIPRTGGRWKGSEVVLWVRRFGLGLGSLVLLLVIISCSAASASPAAKSSATTVKAFMTLYGYLDNSPAGTDIAHPCIHSGAGGAGTYADPITFATDVEELPWCTVIYVPYMERYFIHEDECSQCDTDWSQSHLYRFDMWAGGNAASLHQPERRALLQCEDPNNPTVIVHPPSDLPVTTDPIFSSASICWQPIIIASPGDQTTSLSAGPVMLQIHAVDTSPDETLQYRALGLPGGLSINTSSGLISGTPTMRQRARVTVTASDSYNSLSIKLRWIVKPSPKASTHSNGTSIQS
jgi:hypothetical protein